MSEINSRITKKLQEIAKTFKRDDIIQLFEAARKGVEKEEPNLTEAKLSDRAVSMILAFLADKMMSPGEEINVLIFRMDNPRDQHATLVTELHKRWEKGPKEQEAMMKEGLLMLVQISDKDPTKHPIYEILSPVTKIGKNDLVKDKEGHVMLIISKDTKLWEPGKTPIFRDNRKFRDQNNIIENWNEEYPLKEDWTLTLFGAGYFEDSPDKFKRVRLRYFGELANPNSSKFVGNKLKFFTPTKLKVTPKEKLCTDEVYVVNAFASPIPDPTQEIDIIEFVTEINEIFGKELIPVIDLGNIKSFHINKRALMQEDEDGDLYIVKNESGWDRVNWNEYALATVSFLGVREYRNNYNQLAFNDISSDFVQMDFNKYLDIKLPKPCKVIISITTSRGTTKYDRESKETIQDAEDPDVKATVGGIKMLSDYKDTMSLLEEIFSKGKNLEGDL